MLKPIKNWLVKNAVVLSIVFTILVAIASLVKPTSFPKTGVSFSDKIAHTAIYFILTILWLFSMMRQKVTQYPFSKIGIVILLLVIGYGIFIEFLQDTLTDYRSFDYYDMLANTLGACLGFLIFRGFQQQIVNLKSVENSMLDKN